MSCLRLRPDVNKAALVVMAALLGSDLGNSSDVQQRVLVRHYRGLDGAAHNSIRHWQPLDAM